MTERPSCWIERARASWAVTALVTLAALAAVAAVTPGPAAAQDDLDAACATAASPPECRLAAAAVRLIQPRVGLALWGGNPVPGTASTTGLRWRAVPRVGVSGRFGVVPMELPPLMDRTGTEGRLGVVTAASVQTTIGLVHGFSPLPTVGGLFSVDLIGRVAYAHVPTKKGFDRPGVFGWAGGVRLGVLRESFTLPGLSLTAGYGRATRLAFGDPTGAGTDGAAEGAVSGLGATAAVSRRIFGLWLAGGVGWDRYRSEAVLLYRPSAAGTRATERGVAVMERRSAFGSVTWSRLIYHTVLEVGWQETPTPTDLPMGVELDPPGWWASVAFRVVP